MKKLTVAALLAACVTTTAVAYGHPRQPHIHRGRHAMWRLTYDQDIDDAVWSAACYGNVDRLRYLLAHGARADFQDDIAALQTPLLVAAEHGHVAVVRCLLAHGADVNAGDPTGSTALDYAEGGEQGTLGKVGIKTGSTKRNMDPVLCAKYAEIAAIVKKAGGQK